MNNINTIGSSTSIPHEKNQEQKKKNLKKKQKKKKTCPVWHSYFAVSKQ